jgi:hypothetical protein
MPTATAMHSRRPPCRACFHACMHAQAQQHSGCVVCGALGQPSGRSCMRACMHTMRAVAHACTLTTHGTTRIAATRPQVVTNRMQKTAVVAVHYAMWVPKYKVYQKRVSRHKVGGASEFSVAKM